jgi:hypothetical protein
MRPDPVKRNGSLLQAVFRSPAGPALTLPGPWWLHTDLDVLAGTELAAVDYP